MSFVAELQLQHFRSYAQAQLSGMGAGPVVLCGPNGAGKTNVLEAVSLLSPGRGLRGAKIEEMQRRFSSFDPSPSGRGEERGGGWSVSALAQTPYGQTRIGTGRDLDKNSRLVRINGAPARGQGALAEYLSCVWLTPQMDGLFLDAPSSRRRFLDRLVFSFDPAHAGRVTRYENALRQRSKLLQDGGADPLWLDALEETMAETGAAVAAARVDFTARLQQACARSPDHSDGPRLFPVARLYAAGTIEELLAHVPAVEVEALFKYQLRDSRAQDAAAGGAATGPHKTDLRVFYAAKDMPADQCSTGEQKALLTGIVLAHARMIAAERGAPPILLLDEVAAHFDDKRRAALHGILLSLGGQVWLTGTDETLFTDLRSRGVFFSIENNGLINAAAAPASAGLALVSGA